MEKPTLSNSPESVLPKGGEFRRHSTGKTGPRSSLSLDSEEKVLPHYLRASTSSCHDFCKYGRHHAFAAKGKHPIPPRIIGNSAEDHGQVKNVNIGRQRKKKQATKLKPTSEQSATSAEGQDPMKDVNAVEPIKKPVIKLKPIPEQKTEVSDKPKKLFKQKSLSPGKKIEIRIKSVIASKLKTVEAKSLSPSNPCGVSGRRNSISSRFNPSGGLSGPGNSQHSPSSLSGGLSGQSNTNNSPSNRSGLSGRRNNDSKIANNMDLPKLGERKSLTPPKASLSSKPSGNGERKSLKPPKASLSPKPSGNGERKVVKPPKSSLFPKPSENGIARLKAVKHRELKAASPVNNQKKGRKSEPNGEKIMEKTLYVIEPKPEDKMLEVVQDEISQNRSPPSSLSQSLLLTSSSSSSPSVSSLEEELDEDSNATHSEKDDSISEEEEAEMKTQEEISKDGEKRRLRRSVMIHAEDKDSVPQKLQFRGGKVITLQSENNGPRRLRFRQGRVVGDQNGRVDLGRRSFKKRESVESTGNNPKAQGVMLRHQDVQGKKEEQLFNEVIEETASKLVETRKSKVKALVGAFETVISLQESKPATAG